MRRVLIVANQTAGGRHLHDEVRRRIAREPHSFVLVVPPSPPHHTMTFTEGEARADAQERMEHAVASLRELGAEVEGLVGVSRPMDAVADVLWTRTFDEIIVSTLPHAISRWLKIDLPHRVEKRFGLPVTHVVAEPAEAASGRR
ncbi:MAG: hypothetical protein ACREQY_10350 [Candidatus Binatia bacterium]